MLILFGGLQGVDKSAIASKLVEKCKTAFNHLLGQDGQYFIENY